MPIPKIKPKSQSWRNNKRKYYITRKKKSKTFLNKKRTKRPFTFEDGVGVITGLLPKNFKRNIILFSAIFIVAGLLSVIIYGTILAGQLPDPEKLSERVLAESTQILDRSGETVLYEIHGEEKRTLIDLEEIPGYVKWATIAIEDKDFYKHGGISVWGIFRGVIWNKLRGRRIEGGSTLTQQFVKNSILTPERTLKRKVKEWILSYKLEKKYTKDEILQLYFNEIPYGSTAYGVEAASQRYFGKTVRDLNLAEAAILAALPQAPSKYSPYGPNKDLLLGRQQYILDLMVKQNFISTEEADEAKNLELEFNLPVTDIKAPHFVMYIREKLAEKYGEKTIEQDGLKIYTTIDMYKQEIAEEIINEKAEENEESWQASNAALISIDPKTGQILAMVGSKDYFNEEIDGQVNITTSSRQPGSSLKPLVYASAFIKGYTPDTILYDVVTNFTPENVKEKPYEPHNYDLEEHGPVSIRKALAGSLNVPAVKALYLAGVNNVIDIAGQMGYTTLTDPDRYGLSLVLGGGEVKLLEHTSAFGVFAREGVFHPVVGILKVEDRDGNILEEYEEIKGKKVLDPKIVRLLNNILSDNEARSYAFGERNWLTLGSRPVAAKTGTTNDYRDAWTIGYTPSIVTGVWVGNNDNTEMKRGAAGGEVAAPIWHDFMKKVLGDTPIEQFREPEISKTGKPILDGEAGEAKPIKIDKITGLLATEYTPEHLIEEKIFFEPHSILYFVDKKDPLGAPPKNPDKDPQFTLWETRIQEWAQKILASSSPGEISSSTPPTTSDNLHLPENKPIVKLLTPANNQIISTALLVARIEATAPRGINRAEYYLNNNLLFINKSFPFDLEKIISFLPNGFHNLRVNVCDDVDNCTEKQIEFNLILENNEGRLPISALISSPQSGLALNNIDFPLSITVNINEPDQVASVNYYYTTENNNEPVLINRVNTIDNNSSFGSWIEIPASGTYKIYAEVNTWAGKTITTKDSILIINNINPVVKE